MYVTEIPKEVRDKRTEKIAEELLAEKFPKLMKVKVENEKVGLKLNIQKMKIMASGPIT